MKILETKKISQVEFVKKVWYRKTTQVYFSMIAKAFQKPVTKKYIVEHNMQIDSAFQ